MSWLIVGLLFVIGSLGVGAGFVLRKIYKLVDRIEEDRVLYRKIITTHAGRIGKLELRAEMILKDDPTQWLGQAAISTLATFGARNMADLSKEARGKLNMAGQGAEFLGNKFFATVLALFNQARGGQPQAPGGAAQGGGGFDITSLLGLLTGKADLESILPMLQGGGMGKALGESAQPTQGGGSEGSWK